MKNKYDKKYRTKVSISISPELVDMIDEKTTNRSSLVNYILRDYFNKCGEDVSKIKL